MPFGQATGARDSSIAIAAAALRVGYQPPAAYVLLYAVKRVAERAGSLRRLVPIKASESTDTR